MSPKVVPVCKSLRTRCSIAANSVNQMLGRWVHYMLEVPSRQIVDAVYGGQGNVQCVTWFRLRHGAGCNQRCCELIGSSGSL